MLQGRSAQRALLIQGESGRGKSTLVKAFVRLARQLRLGHTLIDCKYTLSLGSALSALEQDLAHTSNPPAGETPEQHSRRVLAQLKALPQPYLLLLDTFEQASPELSRWLEHDVLARLPDYPALLVVVCGQKVPPGARPVLAGRCPHRGLASDLQPRTLACLLQAFSTC